MIAGRGIRGLPDWVIGSALDHLITGIAWIGASFYFIHLDASLRRSGSLPAGVGGEAWQVHGGGFYRMQKYLDQLPRSCRSTLPGSNTRPTPPGSAASSCSA